MGGFNGDSKDDVFIRSPEWAGLLTYNGNAFQLDSIQYDWIDGWNLSAIDQHFVGDFDGNGRDDVFIRSPRWAGFLAFNGIQFQLDSIQHGWIDGWNLGAIDQHFVGDFDGNGRDDVFIRSSEWAGFLAFNGTQFQLDSIQYGWIDGWNLGWIDQHFVARPTRDLRSRRLWADTTGAYGEYGIIPALIDVKTTFERASGSASKRHKFYFDSKEWSVNGDKPDRMHSKDHIQSVARLSGEGNENLLALSRNARDQGDAALYVARFDGIQSDGDAWKWAPLRTSDTARDYFYYRFPGVNHAGGIQALGSMVFVAADNENNVGSAYIQVLDLRNLADSNRSDSSRYINRLVIDGSRGELDFGLPREQMASKAAAVAAVRLQNGKYLLFVRQGGEGDRSGWFFISDSPYIGEDTSWSLLDFWQREDLPYATPWDNWESINFIPEAETGDVYMVAMGGGFFENKSYLYRLTETVNSDTGHIDVSFEFVDGRGLNTQPISVSTRLGAGIHITPNRNIVSYVTNRYVDNVLFHSLNINEFRYHSD